MKITVIADLSLDCRQTDDSFEALEEWLALAKEQKCDLCIHVGKMFHQALPSNAALAKTMNLLHQADTQKNSGSVKAVLDKLTEEERDCLTFNNVRLKEKGEGLPLILADSNRAEKQEGDTYRTGVGVLVSAKYVSLLKSRASNNWTKVHIEPLILVKGKVVVALYALEHMPQDCLDELIATKKLTFGTVPSEYCSGKTLYSVLIIHQRKWTPSEFSKKDSFITGSSRKETRAAQDLNKLIPIHFDLIIWGNTRGTGKSLETTKLHGATTFCYHPGCVTATRFTESYAGPSYLSIIEFGIKPPMVFDFIRLKSVRKLVVDYIDVEQSYDFEFLPTTQFDEPFEEACKKRVREKIFEMIETASLDDANDKKPFIRLTVHAKRIKPFEVYAIRDELEGIVANHKDAITIAVRATSRHMPDLGSPRTFGKNLSAKKPLETTKISAELEMADYLRRHFNRPNSRNPKLLDPTDLLNRLEASQRRGTTDEDLTAFLDDHSYHVQREVLKTYRESSIESGVHTLPRLSSSMLELKEDYWEYFNKFLLSQIDHSTSISLEAQRLINDVNETIDLESEGCKMELSQLSEFFRSKRFSQSKASEIIYDTQNGYQTKKAKVEHIPDDDEAFQDDFKQVPWEYQQDEIWSNHDCTAQKSKSNLLLSDDDEEYIEDSFSLPKKEAKRAILPLQSFPNSLITPRRRNPFN